MIDMVANFLILNEKNKKVPLTRTGASSLFMLRIRKYNLEMSLFALLLSDWTSPILSFVSLSRSVVLFIA